MQEKLELKIVVDTREQLPLNIKNIPTERGTLMSGDYSIKGLENRFAVERKSIQDLIGSLTQGRERFERELHRLRGFDFARLLIVGSKDEFRECLKKRKTTERSIYASLGTFEARYRVPIVWLNTEQQAVDKLEKWAWFYYREAYRAIKALKTPDCFL